MAFRPEEWVFVSSRLRTILAFLGAMMREPRRVRALETGLVGVIWEMEGLEEGESTFLILCRGRRRLSLWSLVPLLWLEWCFLGEIFLEGSASAIRDGP